MYHSGLGVTASETEAKRWWTKAAERDIPAALFNLGVVTAP